MLTNKQLNTLICKAINEYRNNGASEQFEKICTSVLNYGEIKHLITFTQRVRGVNVAQFGKRVADEGNAQDNFYFACLPGADTRLHREVIIKSKDIEANIKAGKQINDEYREEYVNRHGEIVLSGTSYQNFKYLKNNRCKTLNKQPHFNVILQSNDVYINYICAKEIDGADIQAHGEVVIKSKDAVNNISFARIRGANQYEHFQVVAKYGSAIDNFEVIQEFENCNIEIYLINIFKSKDNETKLNSLKWLKSKGLLEQFMKLEVIKKFVEDYKNGKIVIEDDCETEIKY